MTTLRTNQGTIMRSHMPIIFPELTPKKDTYKKDLTGLQGEIQISVVLLNKYN
jgi:hypothetical protein